MGQEIFKACPSGDNFSTRGAIIPLADVLRSEDEGKSVRQGASQPCPAPGEA
jgi:hypothetical protein